MVKLKAEVFITNTFLIDKS